MNKVEELNKVAVNSADIKVTELYKTFDTHYDNANKCLVTTLVSADIANIKAFGCEMFKEGAEYAHKQTEKDLTDKAKFSSGWDGFYYGQGYKQAQTDFMEKAEKWWYDHLVGFLKEGLTDGVINEFKEFMKDEQ